MAARAWLYDGETAVRQEVTVARAGDALLIGLADGRQAYVPAAALVHVEQRSEEDVYGRRDVPGWRLGLPGTPSDLDGLLPGRERYGRLIDRIGLLPATLIGLALSGAVLFLGSRAPHWLAPMVPPAWEERFGDALVGDFGGKFCTSPRGDAALQKLARRLSPKAAETLNIRVVDIGMVNAAALPGGNIVIFDELLTQSDGPDEAAGVLAHEIAHIEERHVTEAMIRSFGFGLVVSAFGGSTGANVETLLSASYSRGAESEADGRAIEMLKSANISPLPTATFFERMAKDEAELGRVGEGLAYLSTHPVSAERQRRFRESAVKGQAYQPSLSRDEWAALADICMKRSSSSFPA